MKTNNKYDEYMTPNEIQMKGIDVLTKELGPVGMTQFMLQFDQGNGNYTAERQELLKDVTMEDFKKFLKNK